MTCRPTICTATQQHSNTAAQQHSGVLSRQLGQFRTAAPEQSLRLISPHLIPASALMNFLIKADSTGVQAWPQGIARGQNELIQGRGTGAARYR